MEATESPELVLQYYQEILDADSANAVSINALVHLPLF